MSDAPEPKSVDERFDIARHQYATERVRIAEMIEVVDYEATRMASSQRALVEASMRVDFDPPTMRRIVVLERLMGFLEIVTQHEAAILRIIRPAREAGRRT